MVRWLNRSSSQQGATLLEVCLSLTCITLIAIGGLTAIQVGINKSLEGKPLQYAMAGGGSTTDARGNVVPTSGHPQGGLGPDNIRSINPGSSLQNGDSGTHGGSQINRTPENSNPITNGDYQGPITEEDGPPTMASDAPPWMPITGGGPSADLSISVSPEATF